jgi:Tfp pilus assembly protein PilZ
MCGEKQLSLFLRPTAWKAEQKRVHPRVPCSILVDYARQDQAYRDVIRNISVGGAFIETCEILLGPEITMVFSLHDDEASIKLEAEVAWVSQQGIGVKFILGR